MVGVQTIAALLCVALGVLALAPAARAQAGAAAQTQANTVRDQAAVAEAPTFRSRDDLRRIEDRRDAQQAKEFFEGAGHVRKGFEYGGWTSVTFLDIKQIDHAGSLPDPITGVTLIDSRLWYQRTWSSRRDFYVRFRKQDLDLDISPLIPPLDLRTKEQFDVDMMFLDFPVFSTDWRIGRQFLRVGRGLVLSDILDGARLEYRSPLGLKAYGFVGSTLHRSDNIDTNVLGFDQGHNDRTFVGAQGEYVTEENDRVYGFFVDQNDNTKSASTAQDPTSYQYDSFYGGLGSEGTIFDTTLYSGEVVFEGGRAGTANGGVDRERLRAQSLWLSLFHPLKGTTFPTLTFDYAYGSGDANRLSVTDSGVRGPLFDHGDQNFNYFGRFEGGLALQPRLSNLHVVRGGFQYKPLERKLEAPADLLVGVKFSDYEKAVKSGAISDPLATAPHRHVGTGGDFFAAYKPISDVDLLFEYGAFEPGNAFPVGARETTHKFAFTATLSY